jgi:hypothetical protein
MITLSLDWGLGEKGKTEKQAPLSRRKMTFHFSAIMATPKLLNIDAKKWSVVRKPGPINPKEVAPHLPSGDGGT